MDPSVMAMLQKSISAKLCPTVIGKRRDFFYLRCSVVDLSLDPDPELFVPDPDPARMKEQINKNFIFIFNFRSKASGL